MNIKRKVAMSPKELVEFLGISGPVVSVGLQSPYSIDRDLECKCENCVKLQAAMIKSLDSFYRSFKEEYGRYPSVAESSAYSLGVYSGIKDISEGITFKDLAKVNYKIKKSIRTISGYYGNSIVNKSSTKKIKKNEKKSKSKLKVQGKSKLTDKGKRK